MKNRIFLAIFLLLMHLCSWAQIGGDYNPNNPSDLGNSTQEYTLSLKATPSNGGSFNTTSTNVEGGQTYYLSAYPSRDFAFVAWLCNGDTLSKSSSYTYTMPYHDVEIIGVFTYSPSNPSDPNVIAQKYTLALNATPFDGGSFNITSSKVSVGERYNLRAYPNTDFAFVAWLCEGDTLSKSASYDYTMPSHNVDITGVFTYRPSSPSDPKEQALKYQLSLTAVPMNSGSFNISNERLAVGSSNSLWAYANDDFVFKCWMIGDSVLSNNANMDFVMPSHNVQMVGVFEYNPASPENPNRNHWDKQTGEVIVDDFTPGNLSSAISTVISGSSSNDVQMIIVSGRMNSNDFGIAYNYSNCSLLDLSRVTGITEVPSYAFDYTNLETVYLPATIDKIGSRAFAECTKLSSLTIYAMTPPTLESNVFQGVPEGLVVYVPAAAIAQYQDIEAWGKFTLLPIQEDIRSISISLPEGANASDYAQMWLELTNTKSGQRIHYVMTDRQKYTFANIIRNTTWSVKLRNERGDIFGQIDNVEVKDEDVSVVFYTLSKPQSVSLAVQTPDGQDVTSQAQITWTDAQGNYVAQGASLTGLLVGYQVNYSVVLSQELTMLYDMPQTVEYTLKDGGNDIVCQLQAIKQLQISGKVKDAATGRPLGGATISASQTFGGKYSKTLNTKTDNSGVFTLTIANVPTSVAFAASDYVSQTVDLSNYELSELSEFAVPDVSLKSITGATINIGFTYTPVEGETQNWFSNYQNVNYELFNVTKNRTVSQYNVQYPQIVLLEEIEDGDVLSLKATSRTNAFMPVETTATIAEQKAEATFGIVELGQIRSSFTTTGNSSVVGSLYDAEGKLVKTYDYANASLTISNLADGSYTLVTMGSSRLFNTIYDLLQLPQTGLAEGSDYVLNTVEVKSGQVSAINISEVPTLDESKLYYTDDNTSFTVNKPSIVAGNYLTLTGRIDFKPAYATSVSNVQMVVDLPESCEFVENSVMVGNSTSSYTLNGNHITIPMTRYTDRVRFCIIPTLGGEYAPSAFVQFDLDGETVTQPIGSANYTAKDLSISVPTTVAKTTIPVSGTAIGTSNVEIYDNDVLIGQTTSLANGTWATECDLGTPYNLSVHDIKAKVLTSNGLELWSNVESVTYDKDAIELSVVHMYHYNPEMHTTYDVVFDYQNPSPQAQQYTYYIYNKEFSFTIDFTVNDTTRVKDVELYVQTGDGSWTALDTQFDKTKNCWFAVGSFGNMYDGNIPKNVGVGYRVISDVTIDTRYIKEYQETNEVEGTTFQNDVKTIDSLYENLQELDVLSSTYIEDFNSYVNNILQTGNWQENLPDIDVLLEEEKIKERINVIRDSLTIDESFFEELQNSFNLEGISEFNYDRYTLVCENCDNLQPEDLTGYIKYATMEGHEVYVLVSGNNFDYIDLHNNQRIRLIIREDAIARMLAKVSDEGGIKDIRAWIAKLYEIGLSIGQKLKPIEDVITSAAAKVSNLSSRLGELNKYADFYLKNGQMASYEGVQKEIAKVAKDLGKAQRYLSWLKWLQRTLPILNAVQFINQMQADLNDLINLYFSVPDPCPNDQAAADAIKKDIIGFGIGAGAYGVGQAALIATSIGALIPAVVAATETMGTSLLAEAALIAAQVASAWAYERTMLHKKAEFQSRIKELKCKKKDNPDPIPNPHPGGGTNPRIDPSGYVYEGVFSNRLEGVTATAYYKEMIEDMYGDLHENIVKWDAEEYAQENPLFTDANGYYRWDVPQGLWQVKFEKEGYETTYSDWLPVPPPQLEVNIAMKQNRQPEVKAARAYEDAMEVEFDKYMMPELLTTENIMVMQNGTAVEGTVELLNEEVSYEGETETFASKIRFNAAQPFTEQEITLLVNNRVKSYAGIRMQDNYQQTFTIEQEIKQILSDSVVTVGFGNASTLTISVLPASASKGKMLTVKTSSPMILGVETEQVTIGNDGKAEITVSGELPGTAALTFTIEGTDKTAMTIVNVDQNVVKTVAAPKTNIASGTVVEKGTAITLTSETEGAIIYYTLDGSCPCDNTDARKVYDGTPIIINETTTIKAMAVAPDMYESDVVEFTYIVEGTGIDDVTVNDQIQIYPLPVHDKVNISAGGKIIKSVMISSINGAVVASANKPATMVTLDVSRIPTGIYIINITTVDNIFSHKILKVE